MSLTAYTPSSQNMADVRAVANGNLIGQMWNKAVLLQADNEDDFSQFEGSESSGSPIVVKDDLKAGGGDRVHFTVYGELGGSGRLGDDELVGYTEKTIKGNFYTDVEQIRHGVSHKELIEHMQATGQSEEAVEATLLGRWFGNRKKSDAMVKFLRGSIAANTFRPDGKTRDTLVSADTVSTTLIEDASAVLSALGAEAPYVGKSESSGHRIQGYLFYAPDTVLRPIKSESFYKDAVNYADVRGANNVRFRGGLKQWDGNVLYASQVRDKISYGPLGSPLAPKAKLGAASSGTSVNFASTNSTITIYGSGVSQASLGDYASYFEPFRYFPGYRYAFTKKQTDGYDTDTGLSGGTAVTRYAMIYDPADGKWLMVSYSSTSNNGNSLVIGDRQGASSSGNRSTSYGGFTYSSTVNKETFPVGSWIFPCNSKGVVFGYILGLGDAAMVRAYGKVKMKKIKHLDDFEEDKAVGMKTIYGQNVALDPFGVPRNYLLIEVAVEHAGIRLPVVT